MQRPFPDNFSEGVVVGDGNCFFDSLVQGISQLSLADGPFTVPSLRKLCFEYARDNSAFFYDTRTRKTWREAIVSDAVAGGYSSMDGNEEASFNNYLVRIQLFEEIVGAPIIWGRPEIEGRILCEILSIKLHVIEKHTVKNQVTIADQIIDSTGSRSIGNHEVAMLYQDSKVLHILNNGQAHFIPVLPKTLGGNYSPVRSSSVNVPNEPETKKTKVDSYSGTNVSHKRKFSDQGLEDNQGPKPKKKGSGIQGNTPEKTEISLPNEPYQASGLKSSLHGTVYQLKLLMLFAWRGKKEGYEFRLATEMNEAEKFDDVVFQYNKPSGSVPYVRFLQAKHKQNVDEDKITVGKLRSKNDEELFSLQKYFISYLKIKGKKIFERIEIKDFVICTNTDFSFSSKGTGQNKEWAQYFSKIKEEDEILNLGGDRYRFIDDAFDSGTRATIVADLQEFFKKTLEDKIKKLAKEKGTNKRQEKKQKNKKIEELKELRDKEMGSELQNNVEKFLNKLVFAVNQPNEEQLSQLVSKEIGEEFNLIDADLITNDFQNRILNWMKIKQGPNEYLSENKIDNFFTELKQEIFKLSLIGPTAEFSKKISDLNIVFDNNRIIEELKIFLTDSPVQKKFFILLLLKRLY